MAKLDYIELNNYKQHKNTKIVFSPYITTFIGINGSGKTNVLKALKMCLHHGDWREKNIRRGQKAAYVQIGFTNGALLKRSRTKTKQQTYVKYKEGKELTFEGKKDCEQEVEDITGVRKVRVDSSNKYEDLNFIDVLDNPGMITSTAELTLRKLSSVLGINALDTVRVEVAKDLKTTNQYLDGRRSELAHLTASIDSRRKFIQFYKNHMEGLKSLLDNWNKKQEDVSNLKKKFEKFNNHSSTLYNQYCTLDNNITTILEKINLGLLLIPTLENEVKDFSYTELKVLTTRDSIDYLNKVIDIVSSASGYYNELQDISLGSKELDKYFEEKMIEQKTLENQIDLILTELGVCPLCGK